MGFLLTDIQNQISVFKVEKSNKASYGFKELNTDTFKTEKDAKNIWKEEVWNKLHLQIIFYGREYSPARGKGEKDFLTKMLFEE